MLFKVSASNVLKYYEQRGKYSVKKAEINRYSQQINFPRIGQKWMTEIFNILQALNVKIFQLQSFFVNQ